jgi:pilus assembly protein CpaF
LIGRDAVNDLQIADPKVSGAHARLRYEGGKLFVADLQSSNGTFVAGRRVIGEVEVGPGVWILIGDHRLAWEQAPGLAPSVAIADAPTTEMPSAGPAAAPAQSVSPVVGPAKPVGPAPAQPLVSTPAKPPPSMPAKPPPSAPAEPPTNSLGYVKAFLEPIAALLDDESISEIMINGPASIYIERKGKLLPVEARFNSEEALRAAVKNIAQSVGRIIDDENPRLDARLGDGSRVAAVIPPCARSGTAVAIRKFSKTALTMPDLVRFGSLTEAAVQFLQVAVELAKNMIVAGGTGSGKTSLLNVITGLIPDDQRILVLEDSAELQPQQSHVVRLEARMPDKKGRGAVTIRDLLHSSLRLRPDRIIVGEIRGGEAFDLLQAMNTGHGGSMSTIHSNSPRDTLARLENTTLMSGIDLPLRAIRDQISSAIHLILYTSRLHDGSRRVTHITEVLPLTEAGDYRTADIFRFQREGLSGEGKILGRLAPTGIKPSFMDEVAFHGLELPDSIFIASS